MRRMLVGVTLASIALAAAILWSRPASEPDLHAIGLEVGERPPLSISGDVLLRLLSGAELRRFAQIDPEISAMDCRIVAKERIGGDQFLLTEECTWKGGRVERRRFLAFQKGDGPSQGWMYKLAESDT